MSLQQQIEDKLLKIFANGIVKVENESYMHNVPPGSESHFKLIVVNDTFQDKPLLHRHRMINQCLAEELSNGVHALAIHTYTKSEWNSKEDKSLLSPECHGGGK